MPSTDPARLANAVLSGDRRALARAISIVEEGRPARADLLGALFPRSGNAYVVGMTGAPGGGKSTLTNGLLRLLRAGDRSVGVVAIDPASPFTGGSLLGDRVRMQDHAGDQGVFIRSMSARGHLGGLAAATASVLTLLDAAGFDPLIVETVGVGQSEVEIVETADTVVVVVTPGWGDAVSAGKAGLMEIGDVFVVNKADREGAAETARQLEQMLDMGAERPWRPPVVQTVASQGTGIEQVWEAVQGHRRHLEASGGLETRRRSRLRVAVRKAVHALLVDRLDEGGVAEDILAEVEERRLDPWSAARRLLGGAGMR